MADSPSLMSYDAAQKLAAKYGIKPIKSQYVASADEAVRFSEGKPIALKGITPKAIHKSRNGLVSLNLYNEKMIRDSFSDLSKKLAKLKPFKILAQRMAASGTEIIIGGKVDPQFGKMLILGLGGIYVEAFRDFALRVCPITGRDAHSMISQLKSRSVVAPDKETERMLEDLLVRASKLFMGSNAAEMDFNPIIIHDAGYDAVDIRIMV
jgi:succinyl-CoA synthetase beta subunit